MSPLAEDNADLKNDFDVTGIAPKRDKTKA